MGEGAGDVWSVSITLMHEEATPAAAEEGGAWARKSRFALGVGFQHHKGRERSAKYLGGGIVRDGRVSERHVCKAWTNNGLRRGPIMGGQQDHAVVDKHTVTSWLRCVPVGSVCISPISGVASIISPLQFSLVT